MPIPSRLFLAAWRAFALAALALLGNLAQAADPPGRYSFRSYGPDQGLANQAVTSLAQDAAGFVFVGTEDGLFRYDGQRFTRFGTADGLPSDSITGLHATPSGRLWVATQKGLLEWRSDARPAAGPVRLAGQEILGIASTASGHLVVATASGTYEGEGGALAPLRGMQAKGGAAWLGPRGTELLLAAGPHLYRRDARGHWQARDLPQARTESVQAVLRDSRGWIWLRGRQLLLRLRGFNAPIEDLAAQLPGAAVQKGELHLDAGGRVWAPTNAGLVLFEGERRTVIDLAHGLPHEWATTVMVDREGSLWVASEGVHRLQGRLAWTSYGSAQGLPSDTVWAIHRDRAGTLWAATNRGLARATATGWQALPGTADRSFYSFAEDAAGALWVGGNSGKVGANTLLYRAPGSDAFAKVPLSSAKGPSTVNSLAFGADGALFVATMAHGLHRIERDGAGFRATQVPLPGGPADEQVNQLALDANGRLWAAGMKGLALYDGRAWRRLAASEGVRENEIETITPDGDGLWVSYWNLDGLTHLHLGPDNRVEATQVAQPPGLVADTIYTVGRDAAGVLWLGTARGIKRWREGVDEPRARGGDIERFGRNSGLPGEDAAANAFWADADGDVWFGMANGLAHFDAGRGPGTARPPPARVTAVLDGAGQERVDDVPRVPWQARALTFHFAALSFVDEAGLARQVRLLGFEDAWRDTAVSEARYTGLMPGRYTFQARIRHEDGSFGPVASRSVVILPPWWLTPWFVVPAGLALLVLLAVALRWQTRRLTHRNEQLEALVATRTRDLRVANEALQEASMVDPLTGLKNRRYLNAFMPEELAHCLRLQRMHPANGTGPREHNIDLCLLLVDLDHFKQVNDVHGHGAGDAVLRDVGQVLRAACRASDVVVRWGGEEFLILARDADRYLAHVLATQVCEAVRTHRFDAGNGVVLRKTCSVGYTAFPLLPSQAGKFAWEQAVELADQCLYAAKNSGRDGWVGALLQEGSTPDQDAGAAAACRAVRCSLRRFPQFGPALVLTDFPAGRALVWKEPANSMALPTPADV